MHRTIPNMIRFLIVAVAMMTASTSFAQIQEFDFAGNAGFGLLPGNEVGGNTASAATSNAFGDEAAAGLFFDPTTNELGFDFTFEGLNGGLFFSAASGIHLHLPGTSGDPFNQTGPIVFNLNSFNDSEVTNTNTQIADGATSGRVTGTVSFANNLDLIDDLQAGEFYLNIHSQDFTGGELRGSITAAAVPEPSSMAVFAVAIAGLATRRRRNG